MPQHPSMSQDSNTSTPCDVDNLTEEDFFEMLKGVGLLKKESLKTKEECGCSSTILHNRMDEMIEDLQRINMPRRIIKTLTHVRYKSIFEFATL